MPSEHDRWVGQRIAAARHAAGFTVRQLTDRLGWSDHSRLTSYETGRRAVSVVTLLDIARALDRHIASMLVDSPEEGEVIGLIAGNRERAQQVKYLLAMLAEPEPAPPDEG